MSNPDQDPFAVSRIVKVKDVSFVRQSPAPLSIFTVKVSSFLAVLLALLVVS
jgi:hypothetical protein